MRTRSVEVRCELNSGLLHPDDEIYRRVMSGHTKVTMPAAIPRVPPTMDCSDISEIHSTEDHPSPGAADP